MSRQDWVITIEYEGSTIRASAVASRPWWMRALLSKWTRRVLIAPLFIFPMMWVRMLWHWRPGILTAALFWVVMFGASVAVWASDGDWVSGLALLGMSMNAAVVLRNGGRMPVVGKKLPGLHSVWVRANSRHRWLWLADQSRWFGFSVGDFVLIASLAIRLLR